MVTFDWPMASVLCVSVIAVAVITVVKIVAGNGERREAQRLNRDLQLEVARGRPLTYAERTAPPPARND